MLALHVLSPVTITLGFDIRFAEHSELSLIKALVLFREA
jgi:hypothetical protein